MAENVACNKSIEFFDTQFQRQIGEQDYALNPFETLALDYLRGTILDLGCGLGNLSLEAGRRGHDVLAVDASHAAVARINADAKSEGLSLRAIQTDIESWIIDEIYDTIVSIGLLMFFQRGPALELLRNIQEHVRPGGRAIVNVLTEGTTYLDMFDGENYYLFKHDELDEHFDGWEILVSRREAFSAPEGTIKQFSTVIAEKRIPKSERLDCGLPAYHNQTRSLFAQRRRPYTAEESHRSPPRSTEQSWSSRAHASTKSAGSAVLKANMS